MKKIYLAIPIAVIVISLLFMLSSCGDCNHSFNDGEVIKEANCSEYGQKFVKCTICEYGYLEKIDYADHVIEKIPEVIGTCSRPGKSEGERCSLCLEVIKAPEASEKIPHTYSGDTCVLCGANATSDGLQFVINKDKTSCSLLSVGTCTSKTIVVPSSYEGLTVTAIVDGAFKGAKDVKSITIPSTVTSIGKGIFAGCSSLEKISVPFIGNKAGAIQANDSTVLGYFFGTEKSDGTYAIKQYYSASESETYYIPSKLESVVVTDGELLYGTFQSMKSLKSITVGGDNSIISPYCFSGCSALTDLYISDKYIEIGEYAFQACAKLKTITKSNILTQIGKYAFASCTSLESFDIPSGIVALEEATFYKCSALKEVFIPSTLVVLGEGAFQSCTSLEAIELSSQTTQIGNGCFAKCTALKSITIPGSIEKVNQTVFSGCTALVTVTITEGVFELGKSLFYNCSALETIEIPASVEVFGDDLFAGCTSLSQISISTSNPIYASINGDIYSNDLKTLILYAPGKKDTTFTVPKEVSKIGENAFYGASNLSEIIIGENVTEIESYAFYGSSITKLSIPKSITKINEYAFSNCSKLETLIIPSTVTEIGQRAFSKCTSLKVISLSSGLKIIDKYAFQGCSGVELIYIPITVTTIGEGAFYQCNENAVIRCQIEEYNVPSTWDKNWNYSKLTVEYGEE